MQVIEKVKVVPEGYNGAGMNYDGGNRHDVNGKANAGLTLGIICTLRIVPFFIYLILIWTNLLM